MNFYNKIENLTSEMHEFGTFRVTYEPPQGALKSTIDMSISAKADLDQMTDFFIDFLSAAGYYKDTDDEEDEDDCDWGDDGVSWVGNPWAATYGPSCDQGIVYIGSGLKGTIGDDHLNFDPCFGSNMVTFS
jgi:hypothetical protein